VSNRLNTRFTGVNYAQYALCPISSVDYQRLTAQPYTKSKHPPTG